MTATPGYRLDIACCFCGGSLEVDEASRTVRCPHCASVLRIAREGQVAKYRVEDGLSPREAQFLIERQLKKAREPLVQGWQHLSRVYLPFWRVAGKVLTVHRRTGDAWGNSPQKYEISVDDPVQAEITLRHKEVTVCANELFPWSLESLGVRAQIARLFPLEHDFYATHHLVPLSIDAMAARQRFEQTVLSTALVTAAPGVELETHAIGQKTGVIYFPLWLGQFNNAAGANQVQFDPVAKRLVALTRTDLDLSALTKDTAAASASVHIVPHRCPNCGTDLPDRSRSIAFFCRNCRRLFLEDGQAYREIAVKTTGPADALHRLFPFWVFDLAPTDPLENPAFEKTWRLLQFQADRFVVPAFEIANPLRLVRLVLHYNRRPELPRFESIPVQPDTFVEAVLPPDEAEQLVLPLALAARALRGFPVEEIPPLSQSGLTSPELLWLPYAAERYFWQETVTGASIERAAVRC